MADENGSEKAGELGDHESRLSKYAKHLQTDDIIHLLLRGHIYLEFALNTIIEAELKHPEELKVEKMNFTRKVSMAAAMGLIELRQKKPLNRLNDFRNKLAHNLDEELSESALESFSNEVVESIGMKHTVLIGMLLTLEGKGRGSEGLKVEHGRLVFGPGPEYKISDFTQQHVLRLLLALLMDTVAPPMLKGEEGKGKAAGYLYYAFFKTI